MKNEKLPIDMEISEVAAVLSACIALVEALEYEVLLRERGGLITLFYMMRQKLEAAADLLVGEER